MKKLITTFMMLMVMMGVANALPLNEAPTKLVDTYKELYFFAYEYVDTDDFIDYFMENADRLYKMDVISTIDDFPHNELFEDNNTDVVRVEADHYDGIIEDYLVRDVEDGLIYHITLLILD